MNRFVIYVLLFMAACYVSTITAIHGGITFANTTDLNLSIVQFIHTLLTIGVVGLSLTLSQFLEKQYGEKELTKQANPEDYGWAKESENRYTKNNYILYKSWKKWVLDATPKNAPGVVARYEETLTTIDMEEADALATHVPQPSRSCSSRK